MRLGGRDRVVGPLTASCWHPSCFQPSVWRLTVLPSPSSIVSPGAGDRRPAGCGRQPPDCRIGNQREGDSAEEPRDPEADGGERGAPRVSRPWSSAKSLTGLCPAPSSCLSMACSLVLCFPPSLRAHGLCCRANWQLLIFMSAPDRINALQTSPNIGTPPDTCCDLPAQSFWKLPQRSVQSVLSMPFLLW